MLLLFSQLRQVLERIYSTISQRDAKSNPLSNATDLLFFFVCEMVPPLVHVGAPPISGYFVLVFI